MKKIKSILALLLLGGLIVTGCEKKQSDTGGSQPNNSSQSGSGDNGGQQGGGDNGGQQGGGDNGGQQGGDVQTNHFGNKKLTVESISATPADHLSDIQSMYGNAYISLFSEGNAVEMILPSGGEDFQALLGTFAVNEGGLTATVTITESYISALDMHFSISAAEFPPFVIAYNATTSKYSLTMPVEEPASPPTWQANATFICVAAAEAPTHANIPEATPVAWPTAQIQAKLTEWGVEHDTVPAVDVSGATSVMHYDAGTSLSIMVMGGGDQETAYKSALEEAGYVLQSMSYKTTNAELQISVMKSGDDLMISITCLIPQIVSYTFEINESNQWILNDSAKIYIWAWNIYPEIPGHWYLGEKVDNTITFNIPSNLQYGIMARSAGMSDLDAWIDSEVWNSSGQFSLSGTSGVITPAPVIEA